MRLRMMTPLILAGIALASLMSAGSAAEGTPAPGAKDMGVCTEALGIGSSGDACVNVIHASPDAPAVDVYVDGTKALEQLAFGKASGWVALPAGEHQIQVTATGGQPDHAVIDAKVTLEAGAAYEVAATGLLANITPQIYQVNLSKLGEGQARIRVIHTSPDAPAVDVAVKGGDVLIANLAFPNASDYLEVPAGSYDLEVRAAGTTTVALELPGVKLDPAMVYDVFAIGQLSDNTLTVLVVASSTTGMMATPEATASPSM
ncbi:MAG: cell wall anchor [Thermomicrobiales bacterium]|nr:MAG: cell wall anchor [Thermomicrobiales bacterium]